MKSSSFAISNGNLWFFLKLSHPNSLCFSLSLSLKLMQIHIKSFI